MEVSEAIETASLFGEVGNYRPVKHFEDLKKNEKSAIVLAVVVATGVNLCVSGIASFFDEENGWILVFIGITLTLFSIALTIIYEIKSLNLVNSVEGFFIYDLQTKKLVEVPRYMGSIRMSSALSNASKEIQETWESSLLGELKIEHNRLTRKTSAADALVSELIEYVVLQDLMSSLNGYKELFREDEICVYNKGALPSFLNNRFISWYSEKPDETQFKALLFDGRSLNDPEKVRQLVKSLSGSKPYSQFQFILPKGCSVSRISDAIVISHKLFTFSITFRYSTSETVLPMYFQDYYMKADRTKCREFAYTIVLSVKYKPWSILSPKAKKYYSWIDCFSENIKDYYSKEAFLERIGWDNAETIFLCNDLYKDIECLKCGHRNPYFASYCLKCGMNMSELPYTEGNWFCPKCGTKNEASEILCHGCKINRPKGY